MFKAINIQTDSEIISLDPEWADAVPELRRLSRGDALVCPECRQPVRFRACTARRNHFAHKHKASCPYAGEPPELLAARAVLYTWLAGKKWGKVQIEKKLDGAALPRAVDCWLETDRGAFAYWILPSRIGPKRRQVLIEAAAKSDATFHWVFLADLLQEFPEREGGALLSTTERALMAPSEYDRRPAAGKRKAPCASLHYLDQREERLITFRALRLHHAPQLYTGRRRTHPMSEMQIAPRTGEFVHPGEHDALTDFRRREDERERREKEAAKREQERKERQEREKRRREKERKTQQLQERAERAAAANAKAGLEHRRQILKNLEQERRSVRASVKRKREILEHARANRAEIDPPPPSPDRPATALDRLFSRPGTCSYCGRRRTQWASYDPRTKTGLCRECARSDGKGG